MSLKLLCRGTIWHFAGTVAGRRLRGTPRTEDKALARRIADERAAAAWRRHLDGPAEGVTMAQAAIAYRAVGKPTRFLRKVEDHWKNKPIAEVTAEAIRQSGRILYPGARGQTWDRQGIVPTQAIINHAVALGWCSHIRVRRFRGIAATRNRRPRNGWRPLSRRPVPTDCRTWPRWPCSCSAPPPGTGRLAR